MVNINRTIYSLNREQEERHTQEAAEKMGLPYINLSNYPIAGEVLNIIPEDAALQYQVVPYLKVGNNVKVGLTVPDDEGVKKYLGDLSSQMQIAFQSTLISKSSLLHGLLAYKKKKEEDLERVQTSIHEREQSFEDQIKDLKSAADLAQKVSVTKLLDVIIMGAIKTSASDIHLEPGEEIFVTRYRIDGVLQDVVRLPRSQYGSLISRIKYLTKLRMDINNRPQDGRFSFKVLGETIDIRVSTMPSSHGETIVMRLLGRNQKQFLLDTLGFRAEALSEIRVSMSKPHGLMLTSGPTGSGKTSTLYGILSELNKPERKIITLEDPVEYTIEGIEQSQINKEDNYGFAEGLRAALRQDPDIIMVGEIRDVETAEIAIQAGLTGHLVLSTVHANSAPSVFARLLDIGVKPFLLSGSINLVMAQRLVRKLCPECAQTYQPEQAIWQEIKRVLDPISATLPANAKEALDENQPVLKVQKGCEKCNHVGFSGRLALIEVLIPDEAIGDLIRQSAGILEFEKTARAQGMVTMEQDGLIKVLLGQTTVDEVWRVTKE